MKLRLPKEPDLTVGLYLYYCLTHHFAQHLNDDYLNSESYTWAIDVCKDRGIIIDFFLPSRVEAIPLFMFQYNGENYFISLNNNLSSDSQEYDQDYDY
jgi:hypothetical protein